MPTYVWECKKCQRREEVINSLSNSDRSPEHACTCGGDDWEKVMMAPGGRWRFVDQPLKR
jgi:putative FmdB family regulatory protein